MTPTQRILGGLYGSLVGDALGVPVEFQPRADRLLDPVTDMREYGTHGQPRGTWSDDGALLLCTVESLTKKGFDPQDMGERFVRWYNQGLWTAHGTLFDIGIATRKALARIEQACPAEIAGGQDVNSNGNGSLMRILPITLGSSDVDDDRLCDRIARASAITHAHDRSKLACIFHSIFVRELMAGQTVEESLHRTQAVFVTRYEQHPELSHFNQAMNPGLKSVAEHEIESSGYVIDTLTASIWCLLNAGSFADCTLKAVNLGDDTDTTGCVAGGLAGVLYGIDAIPPEWTNALPGQDDLQLLFKSFVDK